MNATTRYILTATAVGAGLLTVGATANALAGNNAADSAPIGPAVVVPSSDPVSGSTIATGPEVVDPPSATDLDDAITPTASTGLTNFGTSTPPAGGLGDDDGVEIEDHEGVEIEGDDD